MQHAGYELPRIRIPRTSVNKGKEKGRGRYAKALRRPALHLSRYGLTAQFQVAHPVTRGFKLPGFFTHWLVSHTLPVVAPAGTFGSGVAAE
jgi:hypothetical protein